MPVFQYAGYDGQGHAVKGVFEADTSKTARQRLRGQGIFVKQISETQAQAAPQKLHDVPLRQFFERIRVQEVVIMTRQLATLVGAQIPLVSCLSALADQTEGLKLKAVIAEIKDDVNEGASLAASLRQHSKIFPPLYINMVQAGEASGGLDTVLLRLADFMEAQADMRGRVRGAMIYPLAMMLVGAGVVAFLMTVVIPKILTLFDAQRKALPLPTRVLQFVSHLVAGWWWAGLLLLGGALWWLRDYLSTEEGKRNWDQLALRLPVFGAIVRKLAVARFARTLSTLLSAGIPLLQAMDITKNVVGNYVLTTALEKARDSVSEGASLSAPLKASGVFPPMVTHMISVGESTGELEQMLVRVAVAYEQEVKTLMDTLTTLLQPVMIIFMGGVVGFIVISVLLPILQLSQGLRH